MDGPYTTGAVCLYWKVSGLWSDCTLIESPHITTGFGVSVSLSGDGSMLAVGADSTDVEGKLANKTKEGRD